MPKTQTIDIEKGTTEITEFTQEDHDLHKKIGEQLVTLEAREKITLEIEKLEWEITPRRIRDSVLTADGKTWLENKEAEIKLERDKL